jgi:hypothetical protein
MTDITERPGFYSVHYRGPTPQLWLEGPPPVYKAPCGYLVSAFEEWTSDPALLTCRLCRERAA